MKVQNFITKDSNITHILEKKKLNQKSKDLPTQEPEKTRTNPNYTLKENFKIYIYI